MNLYNNYIMSDTTSILDLPTDPAGGNNNANVNIQASEMSKQAPTSMTLDQMTINQIVSGLQQASSTGATQLPSRDIAMTTNNIMQDPHVQPNYIPPPPQMQSQMLDYTQPNEDPDDIVENYNSNKKYSESLDDMYSEIQTPLLIAALYFLFQLPFFRKYLLSYFPILFSMDGNLNINGFLFMSALFGIMFYLLNKITVHF
jgi:hypothetical protein